jgi:hypothetical protein
MASRQKRVPAKAPLHRWETVDGQLPDERTQRMAVPGGWIYRQVEGPSDRTICMVYVPAPPWHRALQPSARGRSPVIAREPTAAKPEAAPDPTPARRTGAARCD